MNVSIVTKLNDSLWSFNSTGLGPDRIDFINHVLMEEKPHMLYLQEIWKYTSEISELQGMFPGYRLTGVSGMDETVSITAGRKYGGLLCLWNDSLCDMIKPFKC